ncbi:MAG: hypothetical protein R2932_27400 [Caldilineaceae bacterium]
MSGSRVFAGMLDAELIDREFVTLYIPFIRAHRHALRQLHRGVAWTPATALFDRSVAPRR